MTAAYFSIANFKVEDCQKEAKKIVVWAINDYVFDPRFRLNVDFPFKNHSLMRYNKYILPRSKNAYLQRQEGIFIYPEYPYQFFFQNGNFPAFENFLQAIYPGSVPESLAKKITLPYTQVYKLAKILDREGISKVKMMPTLDNVAESLKNRWKWEAWANKNSGSAG